MRLKSSPPDVELFLSVSNFTPDGGLLATGNHKEAIAPNFPRDASNVTSKPQYLFNVVMHSTCFWASHVAKN